ncbi:hypothetical protein B0I35DRAFT_425167 [Stachybotrys elegans]|uniref:Uncharacterized protein n=1 Tax=Stachybotrys elegans TaxID=80388 RepID=A0A8K0T2G8_9HYPO|nr:hypothetical protein B0I35DRAFT_425167 [Stachybotrys elegans]
MLPRPPVISGRIGNAIQHVRRWTHPSIDVHSYPAIVQPARCRKNQLRRFLVVHVCVVEIGLVFT